MILGSEYLLNNSFWLKKLKHKRIAYLGHSASVNHKGKLILSLLLKKKSLRISCILSPQHGFFSNKQANMITTENSFYKNLKVYSLYSKKTRRLTKEMKKQFDVLLFDLQDVGCRIYTYISTLFYLLEDLENSPKTLIVLDRPNPLGRYVEGSLLKEEFKSFVGVAPLPMSHGFTLGEAALWYKEVKKINTNLNVIKMKDYNTKNPWPENRVWILPSPNMTSLACSRCYLGSVLLEGTKISEGRGTNLPFQMLGRPQMNTKACLKWIKENSPQFLKGCFLRPVEFEPSFDKFKNQICSGFQIHLEKTWAKKGSFQAYRFICSFLKAFREIHPSWKWKKLPPYEYEYKLDPIDIISGSSELQKWIQDSSSSSKDWDDFLRQEEKLWKQQQKDFFLYP
ncbi:MAG: DUF1343 domain-containing protein [Bdellovibrionales bacterium]|nr:DUF1343 domain-containing protein [Bdellovibrionales bacterium]